MPGELLSQREIFKGDRVRLRLDRLRYGSRETDREVVVHPGAAAAVPLTGNGEVLLVRQYRHAIGSVLLEIPAGTLEEGESPEDCIRRELVEEAGFQARELEHLVTIVTSPGVLTERIFIYLARGEEVGGQKLETGEELRVARMGLQDALDAVYDCELVDAKSLIGLTAAWRKLGRGGGGRK